MSNFDNIMLKKGPAMVLIKGEMVHLLKVYFFIVFQYANSMNMEAFPTHAVLIWKWQNRLLFRNENMIKFSNIRNICTRLCEEKKMCPKPTFTILFFFPAQEMVEKDFTLLIGLSVALTVFLVVSLTSIRILRRKGRSPSMYTMTNLSKKLKLFLSSILCGFQKRSSNAAALAFSFKVLIC